MRGEKCIYLLAAVLIACEKRSLLSGWLMDAMWTKLGQEIFLARIWDLLSFYFPEALLVARKLMWRSRTAVLEAWSCSVSYHAVSVLVDLMGLRQFCVLKILLSSYANAYSHTYCSRYKSYFLLWHVRPYGVWR